MATPMNASYECNGQPLSAAAFYAIACDPRRSVAVEACAGAGKTWMLVSRMVRALLNDVSVLSGDAAETADAAGGGVSPHEILAITFTKKAAGEMRERLDQWLLEFSSADDATLETELRMRGVAIPADAQASAHQRKQLSNLYRSVLASGRSVQIRTFHSWFAALLRSAPVAVLQRLGLPVNYELLEDDSAARALVWRRFYAQVSASEALRQDFGAVVMAHGRSQTDKALQAALVKRVEFGLADAHGVVEQSVKPAATYFAELADDAHPAAYLWHHVPAQQAVLAAAKALGGASAPTFSAKGVELEAAFSAQDFAGVASALLTQNGSARKFSEKIIGIQTVRDAQELVLRLVSALAQQDAWDYQQRMLRLSRVLIAEFTALKRERGWVDMNDVEGAALVMLGEPVLSGWVQERLDARIKHLMIDEFQDTNPLQWQALYAWLQSYGGAVGSSSAPSVFLVGDPKQSIYRFRRAEPQVFKAAQKFVQDGLGGDLLTCDHTRRNAQTVIRVVNHTMLAAQALGSYDGFRPHTTDSAELGQAGYLPPIPRPDKDAQAPGTTSWRDTLQTPRELPEETLRTLEARQAAAWIAEQLQAGLAPRQIMVLSRKRAGLLPLQEALRALHIPAQIGEKANLIDACEVQDIVALLDVLVSTPHDLSLARALRSPLFGLDDAALVALALLQREHRLPWFDLLQKEELLAQAVCGLGPVLMRWKGWVHTLPPHDALQAIYDDGDVLARFAACAPRVQRSSVLANLRALLGVALQLDMGRYVTPYALVRALKAGGTQAPATLNTEAVRLLTIHGAKGLEAQAVLLLDTDTPERAADHMGVLIDWPGEDAFPRQFAFVVSENSPPLCCEAALVIEQTARQREELNALYVAMTRARHTLAVSSITPHRDAPDSWWKKLLPLLMPWPAPTGGDIAQQTAAHINADSESATETFTLPVLPAQPAGAMLPAADSVDSIDDPDAPDSPSARVGLAMHRLLEWGGGLSDASLAAVAREFALTPAQTQEAQALTQRIAQGEGAWAFMPSALSWQGNEVELMHQHRPLRIDRLVQRQDAGHEGHWWVLDYKTAAAPQHQPAYVSQLHTYRAAVQTIYPEAVVKAAFLTGDGRVVLLGADAAQF